MNKRLALASLLTCLGVLAAWSFSASNYATSSRLSSGKWVKIEIPSDGVYELTGEELAQMGFNDLSRVAIYGYGGHMLNEVLTGTHHDDLSRVPTLLTGNKICFYANGPTAVSLNDVSGTMPYFNRVVNTYSRSGYYFVTEAAEAPQRIENYYVSSTLDGTRHSTSLNWFLHEKEENSISESGKDLLGERLMDMPCDVEYNFPKLADPQLTVLTRVAAVATSDAVKKGTSANAAVIAGGETLPLDYGSSLIAPITQQAHYRTASPVAQVTLPGVLPQGKVRVNNVVPCPEGADVKIINSYLDYLMITYEQHNSLAGEATHQLDMYYPLITEGDTIVIGDAPRSTMLWNVDGPVPVSMKFLKEQDGKLLFASPLLLKGAHFVAFDPEQTLCRITGYEEIENQNLHACSTPDYLIFTIKEFAGAAEKLAELHRSHDGMDVLVVTQDQVFNEFSSGTPDAMALRLLCKMFYDRDPRKFKYLLMFGQGSFDNRQYLTKNPGVLITFETDDSEDGARSYSSDDFYGILDDGTGGDLALERVRLGVGRLTPADVEEAENDVVKVAKYVAEPDYGPWRNNAFISADKGDDNLHVWQAQGLCDLIKDSYNIKLNQLKAFIPLFPNAVDEPLVTEDKRTSPEATRYMAEALSSGVYYSSYVGHAYSQGFTKSSRLWTTKYVKSTPYPHFSIMTTACCDAAPFDQHVRGIAEHMVHKVDGGTIALLTSTRSVFAESNDKLNQEFTKAFFTLNSDGSMPTLGEVTMRSKLAFTTRNYNKMMFLLLGDPAIRINYPLPRFKVTRLNNTQVGETTSVGISPMQYLEIEAEVMGSDGATLDNTFTGDATVTLFDAERFYKAVQPKSSSALRDVYYPRQQVAQVDARVVNGVLKTKILVPRDLGLATGNLRLSLYAHKEGTSQMVNGWCDNLVVNKNTTGEVVTDDTAPNIQNMYFDDAASFADAHTTTPDGILYISVTDETALNMGAGTSGSMKLSLDDGDESYYLVKDCGTLSNGGKRLDVVMPMSNLTLGYHTLTFTVQDVAGNSTSRSIDFYVEEATNVELAVNELPATAQATFVVAKNALSQLPELTIKVTDAVGNIVWQKATTQFPCTWNLKGLDGKRVPNGVYRFWATYDDDTYYGGTSKRELIVVEPLN